MNIRAQVIAYCKQKGYDVLLPTKQDKTILVYESNGQSLGKCLAEASNWLDISKQLAAQRAY